MDVVANTKRLMAETGCSANVCSFAIDFCNNDFALAKEFLRLTHSGVARYKMVDGVKVPYSNSDYLELAEENLMKRNHEVER